MFFAALQGQIYTYALMYFQTDKQMVALVLTLKLYVN